MTIFNYRYLELFLNGEIGKEDFEKSLQNVHFCPILGPLKSSIQYYPTENRERQNVGRYLVEAEP